MSDELIPCQVWIVLNKKQIFHYGTANYLPRIGEIIDLSEVSDSKITAYKIKEIVHKPRKNGTLDIVLNVLERMP